MTSRRETRWHQPFKCVRYTGIDLEFGYETSAVHEIMLDDPNSAISRFEHRLHFKREDWEVKVRGTAKLTSTVTAFNLSGAIEVHENGRPVFQRSWAPKVPRTCS